MLRALRLSGPGVLAAAAVLTMPASAGAAPAPAGAVRCGVAETVLVEHPAEVHVSPALTHREWQWTRTTVPSEAEHTRTVGSVDLVAWERVTELVSAQYGLRVVDQPFVPAQPGVAEQGHYETHELVPEVVLTEWEYEQVRTGARRWEAEGWNAGAGGTGWSPTGSTRGTVLAPAVTEEVWVVDSPEVPPVEEVPEVAHTETAWFASDDVVPEGWQPTGATRVDGTTTDRVELPAGEEPGTGWTSLGVVGVTGGVLETLWAASADPAAGWQPTGATRAGSPVVETTPLLALAPEGPGWVQVPGSEVVVVDRPEETRVVREPRTEEIVLEPVPCAPPPAGVIDATDTTGPGDTSGPGDMTGTGDTTGTTGTPGTPTAAAPATAGGPAGTSAAQSTSGDTVLPATGNPASPATVLAGLALLGAGSVLVRGRRPRRR